MRAKESLQTKAGKGKGNLCLISRILYCYMWTNEHALIEISQLRLPNL